MVLLILLIIHVIQDKTGRVENYSLLIFQTTKDILSAMFVECLNPF